MDPLIITAAITGAELSAQDCKALPITASEQIEAAAQCVEAGASIIHLHVRDDSGKPTQDLAQFQTVIEGIRKTCNPKPLIQISTGGAVGESMDKRLAPLSLRPEMASFNTGTMNFGEAVFENTFSQMRRLAQELQKYQVLAEYEIYDFGHLDNLFRLEKEGVVAPPFHLQFVLGVMGGMMGDPLLRLAPLVGALPPKTFWGVAGVGRFQLPLSAVAIASGGHVRVGLEDNIYFRKGELAQSNAQLVQRVATLCKTLERPVATCEQTRKLLGI